jgi:hypothetical protein
MQAINKGSTKIMNKICESLKTIGDNKTFNNAPNTFLALHAEVIGHISGVGFDGKGGDLISIAHYVRQDEELIADPEICFIRCTLHEMDKKTFAMRDIIQYFPYYIKQITGREREFIDISNGKYEPYLDSRSLASQKDTASFANMWFKNIKYQQNL